MKIVSSHQATQELAEKTGTNIILLSSSDYCVSVNPEKPSVFRGAQQFQFSRGETIPNIFSGTNVTLPFSLSCSSEIIVKASANNGVIEGNFTQYVTYAPPVTISKLQVFGTFKAEIAI